MPLREQKIDNYPNFIGNYRNSHRKLPNKSSLKRILILRLTIIIESDIIMHTLRAVGKSTAREATETPEI